MLCGVHFTDRSSHAWVATIIYCVPARIPFVCEHSSNFEIKLLIDIGGIWNTIGYVEITTKLLVNWYYLVLG